MHDPARQQTISLQTISLQTISLQTMSLFDDKPRIRVLLRVVRSATHFLKSDACCSARQDTREHTSALSGKVFALVLDAEKVRWELACLETCTAAPSLHSGRIREGDQPECFGRPLRYGAGTQFWELSQSKERR